MVFQIFAEIKMTRNENECFYLHCVKLWDPISLQSKPYIYLSNISNIYMPYIDV